MAGVAGPAPDPPVVGPSGFSCPRADVDFRGGTTLVTMLAPPEYGGFATHNR